MVNTAWVVSTGVGIVLLALTQSAPWGLAAGVATFFLVRWLQPAPFTTPPKPKRAPRKSAYRPKARGERETPIEVVCKVVTPARQEWVSLKTGRLYDVLSVNGLANAQPGDRGRVVLTGTHWRIVSPTLSAEEVEA